MSYYAILQAIFEWTLEQFGCENNLLLRVQDADYLFICQYCIIPIIFM